jgi:predicted alpha/beta hydrolase family esterase
MKRAVLLHGTDGNPDYCWFPWLVEQLAGRGIETFVPLLPENHTPNRSVYEEFLKDSGWDFSDNLLVGHSSGATSVLNILQTDWLPKVDTVVLVGTFLNEKLLSDVDWYEPGQFDALFPEKFDIKTIKSKAKYFYFIHSDDDRYCDIEDAKMLCEKLGGKFITVPGGKHLSSNCIELPEILPILKQDGYV